MQSRQIITLVIIIAAIAGAGVFAYMSLSGGTAAPEQQNAITTNPILPHGADLDFNVVNEYNETGRQFQYPVVTPSEAGLTLNQIIQQ